MSTVLVIDEDTLIRELMREHLEREGFVACAVSTVRVALGAARWTHFGLVLLDFTSAAACDRADLDALRELGAPVVMMHSAPAGTVIGTQGEIEQVVWSPFDLSTLTLAVRRFLPTGASDERAIRVEPMDRPFVKESGTYAVKEPGLRSPDKISTLPAPADAPASGSAGQGDRASLDALGWLVLEATGGRRVG